MNCEMSMYPLSLSAHMHHSNLWSCTKLPIQLNCSVYSYLAEMPHNLLGDGTVHSSWSDTCINNLHSLPSRLPSVRVPPWEVQGVGVDGWRTLHFPSAFQMPNIYKCIPWKASWERKYSSKDPSKFELQSTKKKPHISWTPKTFRNMSITWISIAFLEIWSC